MTLIPPFFLDCVVAIGVPDTRTPTMWIATGFLYGRADSKDDQGPSLYSTYLVTNRHVLSGQKRIHLRFNPSGTAPAKEYAFDLFNSAGNPNWFAPSNPNIDVAVGPIDFNLLVKDGINARFFEDQKNTMNTATMKASGISEGDFVYVLGFPFGDTGGSRNYVIARSGTIARINDTLNGNRLDFLLDVPTYPGNSGGPVILKPEMISIQGTKSHNSSALLGVTSVAINYVDEAISRQTGSVRVRFEDNSGLSIVYPMDYVEEAIDLHLTSLTVK